MYELLSVLLENLEILKDGNALEKTVLAQYV
jgi:hypothetical protein